MAVILIGLIIIINIINLTFVHLFHILGHVPLYIIRHTIYVLIDERR